MRNLCKINYFNGNSLHLRSFVNVKHKLMHNRGAKNLMIKVYCTENQIEFNSCELNSSQIEIDN